MSIGGMFIHNLEEESRWKAMKREFATQELADLWISLNDYEKLALQEFIHKIGKEKEVQQFQTKKEKRIQELNDEKQRIEEELRKLNCE